MGFDQQGVRGDGSAAGDGATTKAAGRRSLVETTYPTLARAMRTDAPTPTIHDAATAAVEHKGSGQPVDGEVAAKVGGHLGADFSGVRVHRDPLAAEASAAMGARAFAHGADVFMAAGESSTDLGLMAHELTHVAQQGAAGQRALQRKVEVGDANSPAEHEADAVAHAVTSGAAPSALLVDDGPVAPGQMLKSTFMAQLRDQVATAADQELGPFFSAMGCPYIDQYFQRYGARPAADGEALLRRFAPATRSARAAADMIPAVVARVRDGVRHWRDTGAPPPDLAALDPAASAVAVAAAPGGAARALRAPDGRETLGSLEAALGPGVALDGAIASRMGAALGADLGAVRIHTGAVAAAKAAAVDATAFAVGPNIVMGAGAPGLDTLDGEALLAHELAHTVQQADAARDPLARMMPIGGESAAAESAADAEAAHAVAATKGKPGLLQRLTTATKTGLQLQRCPSRSNPAAAREQAAHDLLVRLNGLAEADFRRDVAAMTRQQTEELLNNVNAADRATYAALLSRIRNERLVSSAESLAGHLYWAGNSGPDATDGRIKTSTNRRRDDDLLDGVHFNQAETNTNEFAVWVRGGAEPTDASRMNCWEMILYAGWRAGIIPRQWIMDAHADAAAAGGPGGYMTVLGNRLNLGSAVAHVPGAAIPRGNLVFFDGLAHVALSTGNLVGTEAEVMSLWIVPTHPNLMLNSASQRTTVEAIQRGKGVLGAPDPRVGGIAAATMTVTHAPNPWR